MLKNPSRPIVPTSVSVKGDIHSILAIEWIWVGSCRGANGGFASLLEKICLSASDPFSVV